MLEIKKYRIKERNITSLEGSTFVDYYIQERRFKYIGWLWKDVISVGLEYPYYFYTKREANEFIINELIGKINYRNNTIDEILDNEV